MKLYSLKKTAESVEYMLEINDEKQYAEQLRKARRNLENCSNDLRNANINDIIRENGETSENYKEKIQAYKNAYIELEADIISFMRETIEVLKQGEYLE